jgi:ABC-type glycerol-3-phosphate transport system substrate-binding protein
MRMDGRAALRGALAGTVAGLAALTIAACGGGDGSDSDDIRAIIVDIGDNPSELCEKYATEEMLNQAGGKEACLEAAKSEDAKDPDVKVDKVTVDGDKATAEITSGSGSTKGNKTTLTFVKEGDDWKLSGSN